MYDPATFETTIPGMFVAGVLCKGMRSGRWLIENSRYHGKAIFDRIEELLASPAEPHIPPSGVM